MKVYRGLIVEGLQLVEVVVNGVERPLIHQAHHSPTGMAWGYQGSGPADLARSILADLLGRIPHPAIYNQFWRDYVRTWPKDQPWDVTDEDLIEWINDWKHHHKHWNACPTCGFTVHDLHPELDPNYCCTTRAHYQPKGPNDA